MKKILSLFVLIAISSLSMAQTKMTLHLDNAEKNVSPTLYGLMTEEINYSYEGGLYAQLLRNPSFKEVIRHRMPFHSMPVKPKFWELTDSINATMHVEYNKGINRNNNNYLSVNIAKSGIGLLNNGFWGLPIHSNTEYNGSLFAKGCSSITVKLESDDNNTVYAQTTINNISDVWKKYYFKLLTNGKIQDTKNAHFVIVFNQAGTCDLSRVTLFSPTYNNRTNGLRKDLMAMMKGMNPKFLRFPGGNYVEGNRFCDRFDWRKTIGCTDERPGHLSPWGYWSTDGMGLLEFMQWAEDVGAEPLLAVFAGYTLNGDHVEGDALKPFIQDAIDEIEYVIGGADTKYGAQRIKDGHPNPFPLHYIEIGNEDFFDISGSYSERYKQFYDAIKSKYPQLKLISTIDGNALRANAENPDEIKLDVIDEHYYRNAKDMYRSAFQYDKYDRKGPKIFCGEWATREGKPTTNMNAALGDAAWMTCLERNSDLVMGACYAPLFVNVSPGAMQWESDLIGYDALKAYGSPSYYAQVMFGNNLGNKIVPIDVENMPQFKLTDKANDTAPEIYYTATKDNNSGRVYLKIVNVTENKNEVELIIAGNSKVNKKGYKIELKSEKPDSTNTIDNPKNIIPVKSFVKISKDMKITLSPYSITVLSF